MDQVFAANLAGVVSNCLSVGVERFLLAGAIESQADLDGLHASVPMPLRVVRLTVPYEVIDAGSARRWPRVVPTTWRWQPLGWRVRQVRGSKISPSPTTGPSGAWPKKSSNGSVGCEPSQCQITLSGMTRSITRGAVTGFWYS
jgi:hypothetical protein